MKIASAGERRAGLLGIAAPLLGVTASQASLAAPPRQDTPVRGGSIRVGVPGSAETFDPNVAFVFEAIWPCELLYSSLVRLNPALELEPDLALSWAANDDLTQWTFALREGVTWHDGGDFTSTGAGGHLRGRCEFEVLHDGSEELQPSGIVSLILRRGWQRRAIAQSCDSQSARLSCFLQSARLECWFRS